MNEKLRPYPEYRESGVAWLGRVPAHWDVLPLRRVTLSRCDGPFGSGLKSSHYTDHGVRVIRLQNIGQAEFRDTAKAYIAPEYYASLGDHTVIAGDVIIAGLGDERHPTGRACVAPAGIEPAMVKADCFRFRLAPSRTVPAFVAYQLTATAAEASAVLSAGATRQRINLQSAGTREIALPAVEEQHAIVRYLDDADRRIRRYIRAKQRLIALLEEQKRLIVHRAVTRGLDPDVPLKSSDVEWLGDVPAHWQVAALRHRFSVQLGKMLDVKRITGQHLVPYLRNTDVQWDRVNTDNLPTMDVRSDEYGRYTVRAGDLLVCEGGEVGRAALWSEVPGVYAYQKALHRLRPLQPARDHSRYLFFVLFDAAKRGVFQADGSENTIAHLPADKFRAYRFAFPPAAEQQAIVAHLNSVMAEHAAAVGTLTNEISLICEYRTRLVADVVTGKLDVRAATARMPNGTDELEAVPLDDAGAPDEDMAEDAFDLEPAEA